MSWRRFFRRARKDAELSREVHAHLAEEIDENLARGVSPEEASRLARLKLGNPQRVRETLWQQNTLIAIEGFGRDLRYAARALMRAPGFTAVAILVLALGIGANTALFTVVRSVLLKPLPFQDAGRLVRIYDADSHNPTNNRIAVSGADFFDWQKQARSFEQMALLGSGGYNLSGSGGRLPKQVAASAANWNLFSILRVEPALGRLFTAGDDRPDANATAVLTWGLWKRRYGGDPHILGQTILLDAKPYTVIGVLPAWFSYPHPTVQLWTPILHEATWPGLRTVHGAHNFAVVARLKPGVAPVQAQAELTLVQSQIRQRIAGLGIAAVPYVSSAATILPLLEAEVGSLKPTLYTLLAATGCLLLIACLNIANLLVARAASRQRETAIRASLGGTRSRLIREQVMESVLLSAVGGAFGLLLATLTVRWLVAVRADLPRATGIHLDGAAVLFSAGSMLLCGLSAGLIPALSFHGKQILRPLQESSRSQTGSPGKVRLRRTLLSLEVGLTVLLLISAGLLLKSYARLRSVNIGCATKNVLTMGIGLPEARYKTPVQVVSFYEQLIDRIRALPGVQAAALTTRLPGTGHWSDHGFVIHENPSSTERKFLDATVRSVDPGFFHAMQVPLLHGRVFLPRERTDAANVAVVTQAFVREFFPDTDPLGKHIDDDNFAGPHSFEIVGVVGDVRETVSSNVQPTIYFPLYRGNENSVLLAVRTSMDAPGFALPVQKIIAQMDRDLGVADVLTMDQILGKSTLEAGFDATVLLVFAVLSLVLAAVGLFGVLSYILAQRTGEIGIRIALGAQREQVLRLMLADGMRPALFGLVLGLAASMCVTRLIQSMLYGTHPLDPMVFGLVTVALLLVAAAACALPAWRASRLDPMQALRTQ